MKRLKSKKGFTMIEIIIVLVILAILIGAAVPSFIGFVNEARAKAYMAEANLGRQAAQNVWAEYNAIGTKLETNTSLFSGGEFQGGAKTKFENYLGGDVSASAFRFAIDSEGDDTENTKHVKGIYTAYYSPDGATLLVVNVSGTTDTYNSSDTWPGVSGSLKSGYTSPSPSSD